MDWPWSKRATVNKPIDWAGSWSLDESVKGISFEMDEHKNIKAHACVMIDTSQPNIVPAGINPAPAWWGGDTYTLNGQQILLHGSPAGQDSYIAGVVLEHVGETLAVAAVPTLGNANERAAPAAIPASLGVYVRSSS